MNLIKKNNNNHIHVDALFRLRKIAFVLELALFRLRKIAFVLEPALAKARKSDSEIQIKDKQDLVHALIERDTFTKILNQADDVLKSDEYLRETYSGQDEEYIIEYFMRIRDKINSGELRFY